MSNITIIDCQPILSDALAIALNYVGIGKAYGYHSYAAVPDCLYEQPPDVLLINIKHSTDKGGIDASRRARAAVPHITIVLLAPQDVVEQDAFLLTAVEAGVDGILTVENIDLPALVTAINAIQQGHSLINPQQLRSALEQRRTLYAPHRTFDNLFTPRERDIAMYMVDGATTSQMANDLVISERTVRTHISNILAKLDVCTRYEAMAELFRLLQTVAPESTTARPLFDRSNASSAQ